MEKSEIKAFIAKRCAKELKDGDVVNLGIGLPTMIPSYLPEGVELIIPLDPTASVNRDDFLFPADVRSRTLDI